MALASGERHLLTPLQPAQGGIEWCHRRLLAAVWFRFKVRSTDNCGATPSTSSTDDVYRLKLLDPFIGERALHQIHDGTLAPFIAWRRRPVEVKRKSRKVWRKQVKTKTIDLDLALVHRILNQAARK